MLGQLHPDEEPLLFREEVEALTKRSELCFS
jgi:hypothetical protein